MPAVTRTPRSRWIAAGLQSLAAGGPAAVRVETLAAGLGVTKGGFYGYFADRAAFLTELLDEWERRSTDDVLAQVEAEGGAAATKIRRAGALTFSAELLPVDLAVRSWARHDAAVAARLRHVDNARLGYLRSLFGDLVADPDEVEARSTLAFALAIGQHFMAADHGKRGRRQAIDLAAALLLASPGAA
ncbi:MAG TPA: TetR/AcrR family transcriptional regulator [Jatrophihabitans sp.]|nr:TetR/AcrR family transcriptional regulator [Jatrophihabitans sp.]